MLTSRTAALAVFAIALATILGAWGFQWWGYDPCQLCYKQRWAYYAIIPLALIAWKGPKQLLWLIALAAFANAIFGVYHAGIEWKWWEGPSTCGGDVSEGLPDLTKIPVLCNEAAIRILGLSLAGWNAVISAVMGVIAVKGVRSAD